MQVAVPIENYVAALGRKRIQELINVRECQPVIVNPILKAPAGGESM